MDSKQLKLLGLTVDKDCASYILKNLRIGVMYPFCRAFKDFNTKDDFEFSDQSVPDGFFTNDNDSPSVNICAIVGRNGSGKSGLVDIVLRLLNNAGCRLVENYDYTNNLVFVKGLRASLYYSIGSDIYRLSQESDEMKGISLYRFKEKGLIQIPFNKKNFGLNFFYTELLNYSIHAFNTYDYAREWDMSQPTKNDSSCWLNGVFHKNDGYLAPLVLNPKRDKGNIDINNEIYLSKSRLMSMIFLKDGQPDTSYTYINSRCSVSSIDIWLDEESVNRKYENLFRWWSSLKVGYKEEMRVFLHKCILALWSYRYKFDVSEKEGDPCHNASLKYLVYKTISIANKYDAFDNFHALSPMHSYTLRERESWEFDMDKLIVEIDKDRSHVTFRLRQILAYLSLHQYKPKIGQILSLSIEDFARIPDIYTVKERWRFIDIVPPPCFAVEIIVKDSVTGEEFPFTGLSSGERQLSYINTTIIYHLRNLNSVPVSQRRVKYRHVNVVLDEIELYFHPGYQRDFVKRVISCINSASLTDIESVNIIMITHSPFVLSDIPKGNVLFLKDGRPDYEMQENTFAANIHSLLKNGFFLEDGTIGNFARDKVNDMFRRLYEYEISANLKKSISLVGEPILRSQLIKLYTEQKSISMSEEVRLLRSRIESLENDVKSLRDDTD